MDLHLAGKRALITGASKGIGLACAKALAGEGCHTIIAARSPDGLAAAKTAIEAVADGAAVTAVAADLSRQDDRAMLIERFAGCDILVNSAGALHLERSTRSGQRPGVNLGRLKSSAASQ